MFALQFTKLRCTESR